MERDPSRADKRGSFRPNWTLIALVGGIVALVLLVAFSGANRNPDQDKLTGNQVARTEPVQAKAPQTEKLCGSMATDDLIKRELFSRAAQLRGSDQAAFGNLATYASLRMDNAVLESQDSASGAINCSASLTLDLPPGVATVGGHHSLMADVDYTVQSAGPGNGRSVVLRNADAIITPLATLARVQERVQPEPAANAPPGPDQMNAVTGPAGANSAAPEGPPMAMAKPLPIPKQKPLSTYPGHPSFDCAKAGNRVEITICSNSGLAALDSNMASQYRQALTVADPGQGELLERTRARFLAYRDRCPNRKCIADAYIGRMREIRDIMEGRWRAPR